MADAKATVNTPGEKAFMDAVRRGRHDDVRAMLTADAGLVHAHDYDCFGATALNHAGNRCDRVMVDLLLEHGADINARSDWWAGGFGVLPNDDRQMSAFLITRGALVDVHAAAALGDLDRLRELLDADPDRVHARGGDGQLPLHYADTPEVAALLLERGARIDARDIDHESTAAQWQATRRPAVARYLAERGAQSDVFMTIAIGDPERVRALVEADPRVLQARVTRAFFPTSDATQAEHIYIYTLGHNSTPLHVAANLGRSDIAAVLLAAGADVNATGAYDDCTPLHQAAWSGHVDVAAVLLDRGADLERRSGSLHRNQPLGWAIAAGNDAMAAFLLKRGARVHPHHIEDARAGARDGSAHTSAPREAFARIVEMLARP